MTGKHYNWHKGWSREASGHLRHISGLRVTVTRGADYTDLEFDEATMNEFQDYELARGVPLHDLAARLQRLLKEAQQWHTSNP